MLSKCIQEERQSAGDDKSHSWKRGHMQQYKEDDLAGDGESLIKNKNVDGEIHNVRFLPNTKCQ